MARGGSRRLGAAAAVVSACSFVPTGALPIDAAMKDGAPDAHVFQDAPPDAAKKLDGGSGSGDPCELTLGKIFPLCMKELPSSSATVTGLIDTDTAPQCAGSSVFSATQDVCLIVGTTLVADAVRAIGSRPLVLAATVGNLGVGSNGIDVSSSGGPASLTGGPGAAAQPSCTGGMPATNKNGTEGGGAGGSYGGTGGKGGDGAGGPGVGNAGGAGGQSGSAVMFATLAGGCPGANGGGAGGGLGGFGGGVVWLIAAQSIVIDGRIDASGGPGSGGASGSGWGGGGGGAGGLVGLESGNVMLSAELFANGGGGGEGGGTDGAGNPGGVSTGPNLAGQGGTGASNGGAGGRSSDGNVLTGLAGATGTNNDGGGGGGGGAGMIVVTSGSLSNGLSIAPPLTQL